MEELLASLSNKTLTLTRGQTISGEVVALTDTEAILDLSTKSEGVIPLRDFPADKKPNIGDKIDAYVIEPENESSQVLLSMQQAQKLVRPGREYSGRSDRPEQSAEDFAKLMGKYTPDNIFPGIVTKVSDFGVFVKLEEGVEGLIHSSKLGSSSFEVGQKISISIDSIDPEKKRISLSPVVTSTKDLIYK